MSSELALLTQLLARLGKEGDAASAAGSTHGKLEELFARIGAEGDAASLAGSLHAKLEYLATSGGDPGYLIDKIAQTTGVSTVAPGANGVYGAWDPIVNANTITTDFVIVSLAFGIANASQVNDYGFEVGVGASGAEIVVARGTIPEITNTRGVATQIFYFAKPVKVAANARVAIRWFTSQNTTGLQMKNSLQYYPL